MEQQYPLMAVINGILSSISPLFVLVKNSTERDAITDEVPVGTIAYTAGEDNTYVIIPVKEAGTHYVDIHNLQSFHALHY